MGRNTLGLSELRDQFTQLWAAVEAAANPEAPFVLLLDGLDEMAASKDDAEATIADLLPTPTNRAVRIVVSSRPHPPAAEQVRREHPLAAAKPLVLRTFDQRGVQLLLENIAADPTAQGGLEIAAMRDATSIAQRVLALTRGEPLFARFVCQEVVQGGLKRLELLEKDPPRDAEGYFRREIKALRTAAKGDVSWQLLGVLCVAREGLSREDLAGILGQPPRSITPVLERLNRYLLGEERFELMHTLLRDLVSDEFKAGELDEFANRIMTWCEKFQAGGWPKDTPRYVIDHFIAHLIKAGRIGAACDAMDRAWFVRKRESTRGEGAFIADAKDILASLKSGRSNGEDNAEVERARLMMTFLLWSVGGRFRLGPEYVEFQAVFGSSRDAYYLCAAIDNSGERADAFLRYLRVKPVDDIEPASVLVECINAAAAHAGPACNVGLLVRAADQAAALKQDYLLERALKEATKAAGSFPVTQRAEALAAIAGAWSRCGRLDLAEDCATKAIATAAAIAGIESRHIGLMRAALSFALAGLPSWAGAAAHQAEEVMARAELAPGMAAESAVLAAMAAAPGPFDVAEKLIVEAIEALRAMEEGYLARIDGQLIHTTNRKAWLLPMLASAWLTCDRPEQARELAACRT